MNDFHFQKRDVLFEYNILNRVKPRFQLTQFPYDPYTVSKIRETQAAIEIIVKTRAQQVEGGADSDASITIYG